MSFSPSYDYIHAINGLKGWPMWQPLDIIGSVVANDAPYAFEGRIGHLTTGGTYDVPAIALGSAGSLTAAQTPLILHRSETSFDVVNGATAANGAPAAGQTIGTYGWVAGIPTGNIGALVCTGPIEIESTEFDTTDTFNPGQPLKSPTYAQGAANAGLLYGHRNWSGGGNGQVTLGTDTVVGLVSRGSRTNNYGVAVLAFWPDPVYGTQ